MTIDPIGWANANSEAVQALASLAAVIVAGFALLIAGMAWRAERSQATSAAAALEEARRQADAADRSERSRRWDERVQAVSPVMIERPKRPLKAEAGVNEGRMVLEVPVTAPVVPVLDLRVILRRDDGHDAAMAEPITLAPGEPRTIRLDVTAQHTAAQPADADATPYRLILNWYGQLGQWVVQEWDYDFVSHVRGDNRYPWRLVRWHVDPKVEGMDKLDLTIS